MDEFIENFQTFRDWLYNEQIYAVDGKEMLKKVIDKFEELQLHSAF